MIYTVTALAKELGFSRQWITQQIKWGRINGQALSKNAYVISEKEAQRVKRYLSKNGGTFPRHKNQV